MMNRYYSFFLVSSFIVVVFSSCNSTSRTIDDNSYSLHGNWRVILDSLDHGVSAKWHLKKIQRIDVQWPGSLNQNGLGNEITVNTRWTGEILDSAWYLEDRFEKYRQKDNIKIPFWLQPNRRYVGVAWYQKEIKVGEKDKDMPFRLFLERPHWRTKVWIDSTFIGEQSSLATPHDYLISSLSEGMHTITIRIDNRLDLIDPGNSAHSLSDNTQTNWHGIIGKISLSPVSGIRIGKVRLYPSFQNRSLDLSVEMEGMLDSELVLNTNILDASGNQLQTDIRSVREGDNNYRINFEHVESWDEFNPYVYTLELILKTSDKSVNYNVAFGFRDVETKGRQILVNDRPIFLRGTLDCAIFPNTGYPPTDVASWMKILKTVKAYGLNHVRYHSWCPPEAAFEAADQLGVYMQVEASAWANTETSSIGDGKSIDEWILKEGESILHAYGHHPSFLMMAYGNEPGGKKQVHYLEEFVDHFQKLDTTKLYTGGAGWPFVSNADYYNHFGARIQRWGEGLKSIINSKPPQSAFDFEKIVQSKDMPYISHEIGQWCVYPNFKEIDKYTGWLQPNNYRIFQETLEEAGLTHLDSHYVMASGKLQALCYKADIEASLRTKDIAGFQLLGLQDFPGQGTAPVGVVDAFWEAKPYISPREFKQFCDTTVVVARFPRFTFTNRDTLILPLEIAHFGSRPIRKSKLIWSVYDNTTEIMSGELDISDVKLANCQSIDTLRLPLADINKASQLIFQVSVLSVENSWDFWVYSENKENQPDSDEFTIVSNLDEATLERLENGEKVLWSIPKGQFPDSLGGHIGLGFSSIFWNTSYTSGQKPHTLGILCDPGHPAFSLFPTDYHSNYQWWDPIKNGTAINLSYFSDDVVPIVRIIDDWNENRNIALIFEVKVGEGKLLVSGVDFFDKDLDISTRQLLHSLREYMLLGDFDPKVNIDKEIGYSFMTK